MKITKKKNKERQVAIAMITDPVVLGRIAPKWPVREGLFKTKWANLIGGWCVKYFNKYEKAPGRNIEKIYQRWADKTGDEVTVRNVEKFLGSLSDQYELSATDQNSDYSSDLAGEYFNATRLTKLSDKITEALEDGKVEEAEALVVDCHKIELGVGAGIDVFMDEQAMRDAFAAKKKPLIVWPGAIGQFFDDIFERDSFVAFLGPEKRGKSMWLLDAALRGVTQGRKVAYFEAGDMSQNQVMRRLASRLTKRPTKRCIVQLPISMTKDPQQKLPDIEYRKERHRRKLSSGEAVVKSRQFVKKFMEGDTPSFKLTCHPNSTLSMSMIKDNLKSWERDGWVPDIIIVDYMDILNMANGSMEKRDQINEVWKQMRGISQIYHCSVVTATQANAASYNADLIKRSHFSEDKRKLAHVTAMIGLNQIDPLEKEAGVMRLNFIARREGYYKETDVVYVATCFEYANPAVLSCT